MKMEKKEAGSFTYTDGTPLRGTFDTQKEFIKDGDLCTIKDAGGKIDGQYGAQTAFLVQTPTAEHIYGMNQTSINNLIEFLGDDSENWVGKQVKACINIENVSGKMRKVLYFVHPDGDLLNPVPGNQKAQPSQVTSQVSTGQTPYPEEDINPSDIPFN